MTTHSLILRNATVSAGRSSSIRLSDFASPKWPLGWRLHDSFTFMPHDLRSKGMLGSRKHRWPSFLPPRPLNGFAPTLYRFLAAPDISRDRWSKNSIATNVCYRFMKVPTKFLKCLSIATRCEEATVMGRSCFYDSAGSRHPRTSRLRFGIRNRFIASFAFRPTGFQPGTCDPLLSCRL